MTTIGSAMWAEGLGFMVAFGGQSPGVFALALTVPRGGLAAAARRARGGAAPGAVRGDPDTYLCIARSAH